MNKKTLKALEGSIKKWEGIVAGTLADLQENNCPLCQLFNSGAEGCDGCPVKEKTGKDWCRETPYTNKWVKLFLNYSFSDEWIARTQAQKKAARSELNFLRALRPRKPRVKTTKKRA